jgi:hypothetical protein
MQAPPEQVPTLVQTGQAGSQNPPKDKNAKEMHKLPLDSWDRLQGCTATFLHLSFSPLLPMHESRLKFESMQPRASQVYKIQHKMLHMSKWAS